MKRHPAHELLDSDGGTESEVRAALCDLRWFNRWFGGLATTRAALRTVARSMAMKEFSLLEVASGEGYVPRTIQHEWTSAEPSLQIVLLDRCASHLPRESALLKTAGDALHLPFRDASFDLVCSSLFLHHLSPDHAVGFLREALRVSRRAVVVHDLIRHPLHLALAYLGTPLYRSRLTRNDAPASVWQAYTTQELRGFFERAGATAVELKKHFLFRMGGIAWK